MKAKYKRLKLILLIFSLVCVGLYLILKNFNENIVFFYSPSDLKQKNIENTTIRIGGMIVKDSIKYIDDLKIKFVDQVFFKDLHMRSVKGLSDDDDTVFTDKNILNQIIF